MNFFSFVKLIGLAWSVDPANAMRALYWLAIGKRLRGRSLLIGIAGQAKFAYRTWIAVAEQQLFARFSADRSPSPAPGIITFVLQSGADQAATQRTIDSVRMALGDKATIHLMAGEEVDFTPVEDEREDTWLLFLSAGDQISVHLGSAVAEAIGRTPDASVIYWNTDEIVRGERCEPFVKPARWDPILHAQSDCLASACVVSLSRTFSTLPREGQSRPAPKIADLRSKLASIVPAESYSHVPLFLTHRRSASRAPTPPVKSLALIGFPEPDRWPKISIIIPTRDRVALLRECLDSLKTTAYPGIFEIVVIDNDSTEAETADYLAAKTANESISVVRVPGPFNFSRLNNAAVEHVTGEFICLLNNDVTVIDADWLTALVTVAVGDNVGAVGPMLLYPDGTIQHAGVAIGLGNAAGHVQRGVEPATRIHATWTRSTRRVSAVTAACLLVRRSDYLVVGGLDEADFPVAFNDVDFCLKLQEIGHRNVYVACTALYHHESKSRGSDLAPSNIERFSGELARLKRKWHTEHCQDPWFSPMFSKASERCVLSFLPPT